MAWESPFPAPLALIQDPSLKIRPQESDVTAQLEVREAAAADRLVNPAWANGKQLSRPGCVKQRLSQWALSAAARAAWRP